VVNRENPAGTLKPADASLSGSHAAEETLGEAFQGNEGYVVVIYVDCLQDADYANVNVLEPPVIQ
jgi:hypothetical protein